MKEVLQEIVLCGLSRADFFSQAAFYGGTALRIFHGLDRFSEDLDFSLVQPNDRFDLALFFPTLEREIRSFGLNVEIADRTKVVDSAVRSAFLKANTREHLLLFYPDQNNSATTPRDEKVKIKFEVDVDPAPSATFEYTYRLLPSPYEIRLYDMESLFAGKIHAVLCRGWKSRVKGRDLYDYVFYLSRRTRVNTAHLNAKLSQSGYLPKGEFLDEREIRCELCKKFDDIDFVDAKRDIEPFIGDQKVLGLWSSDFFKRITEGLEAL